MITDGNPVKFCGLAGSIIFMLKGKSDVSTLGNVLDFFTRQSMWSQMKMRPPRMKPACKPYMALLFTGLTSVLISQAAFACDTRETMTKLGNSTYKGIENDAMCCPTQLARRSWVLNGMQLEEGEMEITGTLSIDSLEGSEWYLTHLDNENPVSGEVEVTLLFSEKRISGKSACNRYSAQISGSDEPGSIHIGQSMGTRMACPEPLMDIEYQYLARLAQVTGFSFDSGRLTLSGQREGGEPFAMLFSPAETKNK